MPRQPVRALILALTVAMAPLVFQLPWWAVAWCAASWGYLHVRESRGWRLPSRAVRTAVFIVGLAVVLLSAGLRFDGNDFVALLAVMAGSKALEVQSRRDSMVTVFLAYFLTITSLFVFENLAMTLYLFVSVWITTGVLIHVNDPHEVLGRQMRLAIRLMVTAVPLMTLLFLLFPRHSGSLWGSPWAGTSRSGFTTTMRIGDVSRLVLVDSPAFSASFDAGVPEPDRLYWRGIVFRHFDGEAWHPVPDQALRRQPIGGSELSRYRVILEPHGHRHLFVLDLPVMVDASATIMIDHTLVARRSVRQRFHYTAASLLTYRQDAANPPDDAYLQLPPRRNPRTAALAGRWADAGATPESMVKRALAFFTENGFTYTLRPDRPGPDTVDDFLFVSRKGFCEHFASAFAVLMRAAGVPTRIVGGYQGGRWNAIGGFLTVRHSDAHVWCEVWLKGRGWVRVDPTFAVAPDRIDAGIEGALAGSDLPGFLGRRGAGLLNFGRETLVQTWEAVNTRWNLWFMGFSSDDQMAMLRRLGIFSDRQPVWLLMAVLPPLFVAGLLFFGILRLRPRRRLSGDATVIIYGRFLEKMRRVGLPKAPHLGPVDYARFVVGRYPVLKRDVDEIRDRYVELRYGLGGDDAAVKQFRRQVRHFRPKRKMGKGRRAEGG